MIDVESSLAVFEDQMSRVEEAIFGEGPFSAKNIEVKLQQYKFLETTGQSGTLSLSEKIKDYQETLSESGIGKNIILIKGVLTKLKNSGNNNNLPLLGRIDKLLERIDKYEKEVSKIGSIIQRF